MTGDEPQGTTGRVQTPVVSFPPSFARTSSSKERRLGTRQLLVYDFIVFENLRFRPSTRRREASVIKSFHSVQRSAIIRKMLSTICFFFKNKYQSTLTEAETLSFRSV